MRVATGWLCLALATLVGLFYTHSQVRLVRESYALNERLERRDALHEQHAYLEYAVMALKAPNRLKERLISYKVELKPPKATETVPAMPAPAQRSTRWTPQSLRAIDAEARTE